MSKVVLELDLNDGSALARRVMKAIEGHEEPKSLIVGPDGQTVRTLPAGTDEDFLKQARNQDDLGMLRVLERVLVERPNDVTEWERKFIGDLVAYRDRGKLRGFFWKQRKTVREILKKVFG